MIICNRPRNEAATVMEGFQKRCLFRIQELYPVFLTV